MPYVLCKGRVDRYMVSERETRRGDVEAERWYLFKGKRKTLLRNHFGSKVVALYVYVVNSILTWSDG